MTAQRAIRSALTLDQGRLLCELIHAGATRRELREKFGWKESYLRDLIEGLKDMGLIAECGKAKP